MNKLETLLAAPSRPLLMAHAIAGYPSHDESLDVMRALVQGGADIVELQIPFSDPIADGPTIMNASQEALHNGSHVADAFRLVEQLQSEVSVPVVMMSYANVVLQYGIDDFAAVAQSAGVDGLIVPDLPCDSPEGEKLYETTKKYGINLVLVVSPGVPRERLEALRPYTSGFVYCTSRQGITGADSHFANGLRAYLAELRQVFNLPIGLGFGIKTAGDFADAGNIADIVIAGSVFVDAVRERGVEEVASVARSLRIATT